MADYTITLNDTEDAILQKVAELKGGTAEDLVNNLGRDALKSQVLQYLNDEAVDKVQGLNALEKVDFLTD